MTPRIAELQYRVPYADTDKMGVVYYANYLVYFERARNEILREGGLTYDQLEKMGYMLPVTEAVCNYKNPARYDDILTLRGYVEETRGARIKIACSVHRNEELLASGYTVHACVNSTGRPVRPPEALATLVL